MILNEWEIEPNKLHFTHVGLHCLIKRHEIQGFLNAYVSVPESSPYYGMNDDELNSLLSSQFDVEISFGEMMSNQWTFGISFSSVKDYIPNDTEFAPLAETMDALKQMTGINPTVKDYKNIEHAIDKIQSLAELLSNRNDYLN